MHVRALLSSQLARCAGEEIGFNIIPPLAWTKGNLCPNGLCLTRAIQRLFEDSLSRIVGDGAAVVHNRFQLEGSVAVGLPCLAHVPRLTQVISRTAKVRRSPAVLQVRNVSFRIGNDSVIQRFARTAEGR